MCGLIAYYKTSERPLDPSLIEDMTHALEHRGRDDYGFCFAGEDEPILWRDGGNLAPFQQKGVAMGHRRLSIFDLSEAGRQPFVSADKRLTLVFNGEIYNYIELREELIRHGFRFSTDCDTEVLLAAFEKWGTDCFNRLNGFWSVVIWDRRARELIAARDRLGEKPLLYTRIDGDWIFASEVKAFLAHPKITARPNEQSLLHFIATGSSPMGTETFFADVTAIEPGTFLTFRDGAVAKTKFWDLSSMDLPRRGDEARVAEELDALLTDAVKLRLRGDVRVGAMLSGGMDSTSVISSIATILASRPSESRSIGDTLQAFTASFPGLENDETDKVEELCRLIDIAVFKVFPAAQDDIEDRLNEAAWKLETPFWSPALIVHDALMKLARSSDVKVVLDGTGADEILAGYGWYLPLAVRDALGRLHIREAMGNLKGMHSLHGRSYLKEILRLVMPRSFPSRLDMALRRLRGEQAHWYSDLFRGELGSRDALRLKVGSRTTLERALKEDLLQDNVPRWVHMGDNISMANSVMIRSPFLDYRLVEFAFSLDDSLKVRNGVPKHILREAKRDQLPPSIVNDLKKIQFSGPGQRWLKGPLKGFALSLREDRNSKLSEFLRTDVLAGVIDRFFQSDRADPAPMWRILNSEAWLRAYF